MRVVLFMLISSVISVFSFAQEKCGQHIIEKQLRADNPELELRFQAFQSAVFENQQYSNGRAEKIIIPVVFHVLHENGPENISDDQILDAMRILNEDYSATNSEISEVVSSFTNLIGTGDLEFRLARIDPVGNPTNGIDRIFTSETFVGDDGSKLNPWPRNMYLNIWTSDVIYIGGAAAYAFRPPAADGSPLIDGIISNHRYVGTLGTASTNSGKTLTHEIGHYLGLPHTWGETNSPGCDGTNPNPPCDGVNNCTTDDGINDTPNCLGVANGSCNVSQVTCSSLDNIQNYMDYSSCDVMFTKGQVAVMRNTLNNSLAQRNQLGTTSNLEATGVLGLSAANFRVNSNVACAGSTVQFFDASSYDPDSWSWKITGPHEFVSTDQNPSFLFAFAGTYSVELTVTQGSTTKSIKAENAIAITNAFGQGTPFTETFSATDGWISDNHSQASESYTWTHNTSVGFDDAFCYQMKNLGGEQGSSDDLIFSSIDCRGMNNVSVSFKVAYAQIVAWNSDKLELSISSDCGESYRKVWSASGSVLADATPLSTSVFIPQATDWATFSINNLPGSWFSENTILQFRFTRGSGNHLYLDNINVDGEYSGTPRLVYPVDSAPSMNDNVKLNWQAVPNSSSYTYELDIATGFNSGSLVSGTQTTINNESNNSDTEFATTDLIHGQQYFWRVKSNTSGSESAWSDTWSFTVAEDGVGIESVNQIASFELYPNPVENRLTIEMNNKAINAVSIYGIDGQSIWNKSLPEVESSVAIDVQYFVSGTYYVRVHHAEGSDFRKFIIIK
jgi:PKD repeat protein